MNLWNSLSITEKTKRRNLQLSMEVDLEDYNINKYWKHVQNLGCEADANKELVYSYIRQTTDIYDAILQDIAARRKGGIWEVLLLLDPQIIAGVVITQIIEDLIDTRQMNTIHANGVENAFSIAYRIGRELKFICGFKWARQTNKKEYQYLNRYIKSWKPAKMQGWAKRMDKIPSWSKRETLKLGTDMLQIARKMGVVNVERKNYRAGGKTRSFTEVRLDDDVLTALLKQHEKYQLFKILYRPMITPPIPHTLDSYGGTTLMERRKPTVGGVSKMSQQHLDSLNILQTTEWAVNTRVLEVMKTLFNQNSQVCNLPAQDFEEFTFLTPYPEDGTPEERSAWKKDKEAKYGIWYKEVQKRAQMYIRLKLAEDFAKHKWFYHAYTCDFRGRAYTLTEMLSPQSGDFDRGLLQFANPVKVTKEGMYWLMVHVANCCDGMAIDGDEASDKDTFDDRVRWVKRHEKMLRKISEDPYTNNLWMDNETTKKNPSFQRLAAILDFISALDTGYSSIPVQLDGSCNGSQHWSAIMRDDKIAELVNVAPTEKPGDLYQYVADIGTDLCAAGDSQWSQIFYEHWEERIPRKVFKRSTMCDAYGITDHGIRRYSREEGHLDWVEEGTQKQQAVNELAVLIRSSLDGALESSNDGKRFLQTLTEMASNYQKHVTWITPTGFKAVNRYMETDPVFNRAQFYRKDRLVIKMNTDTKDINTAFAVQAIPPNFIHSLDAAHMMLVIAGMFLRGITNFSFIHDSFGTSCNDVPVMREIINEEFFKIHQENQLALFSESVNKILGFDSQVPLPGRGEFDIREVLQSEYLFG